MSEREKLENEAQNESDQGMINKKEEKVAKSTKVVKSKE